MCSSDLLRTQNIPTLRAWIIAHSDGKADPALVERWVNLPSNKGYMYFFDSTRLHRRDGASMFLCSGAEPARDRFDHCEKFVGKDGYQLGVFTSNTLIKVNH